MLNVSIRTLTGGATALTSLWRLTKSFSSCSWTSGLCRASAEAELYRSPSSVGSSSGKRRRLLRAASPSARVRRERNAEAKCGAMSDIDFSAPDPSPRRAVRIHFSAFACSRNALLSPRS